MCTELEPRSSIDAAKSSCRNEQIFRSVRSVSVATSSFGLVFVEAFSYALPVVSSRLGALPDVVEEGLSGYLVDPDDVQAISERLIALLGDPERAQRGRRHIENRPDH